MEKNKMGQSLENVIHAENSKKRKFEKIEPDEALKRLKSKVTYNRKLAFIVTIVVALLTHITIFTSNVHNWDSLKYGTYHGITEYEVSLGRFALGFISMLRGGAVVPTFTTIVSIILMGLISISLIELLGIKKKTHIIIVSIILATMPTFATTLMYHYCSDAYTLAMLLSVIAVYFLSKKNEKRYIVISGLLIAIIMGLYQAYLGVVTGLYVITLILDILRNEESNREILKKVIRYALSLIIGLILYYITVQVFLKIFDTTLSSYKGADKIGLSTLKLIPKQIIEAYREFYQFFFKDNILKNLYWKRNYANIIFFMISGLSGIMLIIKKDIYKQPVKFIMLIICLISLPIAINIIIMIATSTEINLLMCASVYLIYIMLFAVLEMLDINEWKTIILQWGSVLLCLIITITYMISDQCTYLARQYTYNQAYSTMIRIVDRIETTEGYENDITWCIVGTISNENYPRTSKIYELSIGYNSDENEFTELYTGNRERMKIFLQKYIGIDVTWCTNAEYSKIINSEEFEKMSVFPEEGSTKVINGIMVVKLQEDPL